MISKLKPISHYGDVMSRPPQERLQALEKVPIHLRANVEKWVELIKPKPLNNERRRAHENRLGNINAAKNQN